MITGKEGSSYTYDAFLNNDTLFLVYRVTLVPEPASLGLLVLGTLALLHRRRL